MAINIQSDSTLNYLGAELAITCEALGLNPIHLPGTANKEADFLSRPDTWKSTSLPSALEGIQVETPVERTTEWYRLPPPGPDTAAWQETEAMLAAWAHRN